MDENGFLFNIENIFDLVHSKINLVDQKCKLWHLPDEELPDACNYIVQDLGKFEVPLEQIRIPICQECAEAISNGEWILLYCLKCNQSRWALKSKIKTEYIHKDKPINWMRYCPHCHRD